MNKELAKQAGLVEAGKDEDGETEYIGTREQWEKYDELEIAVDLDIKRIKEEDL